MHIISTEMKMIILLYFISQDISLVGNKKKEPNFRTNHTDLK